MNATYNELIRRAIAIISTATKIAAAIASATITTAAPTTRQRVLLPPPGCKRIGRDDDDQDCRINVMVMMT